MSIVPWCIIARGVVATGCNAWLSKDAFERVARITSTHPYLNIITNPFAPLAGAFEIVVKVAKRPGNSTPDCVCIQIAETIFGIDEDPTIVETDEIEVPDIV